MINRLKHSIFCFPCFWCSAKKGYKKYCCLQANYGLSFKRFCRVRQRVRTGTVAILLASTLGVVELVTQESIGIMETTIVYAEEVHDGMDYEVRLSLSNGDLILTENTEDDRFVSYVGGVAVWQQLRQSGWEIILWTVNHGTTRLTDDAIDDTEPETDGRYVVWQRLEDDRSRVMLYDTQNPGSGMQQISEGTVTSQFPKIEGGRVVWQAWVGSNWEVMSWKESEGLLRMTINTTADIEPDISDQHIVWEGVDPQSFDRDIFAADLTTRELLIVTDNALSDGTPEFRDDGKLTWFLNAGAETVVRVTTDVVQEFLWAREKESRVEGVGESGVEVTEATNGTEDIDVGADLSVSPERQVEVAQVEEVADVGAGSPSLEVEVTEGEEESDLTPEL